MKQLKCYFNLIDFDFIYLKYLMNLIYVLIKGIPDQLVVENVPGGSVVSLINHIHINRNSRNCECDCVP